MRIISGKSRGLKLSSLDGMDTRPTSDRIKETLFNIINQDIYDANVLDLFSGSGSLGIECISRGAKFQTLVEKNQGAIDIINKNIAHAKFEKQSLVVKSSVEDFLKNNKNGDKYNLIFLDPPYLQDLENLVLDLLYIGDYLSDDGIIIIEHSTKTEITNQHFEIYKQKVYKVTTLTFLQKIK